MNLRAAATIARLLAITLALSLSIASSPRAAQFGQTVPPGVTILRDDPSGLEFLYEPARPTAESSLDPEGGLRVLAPGHVQGMVSGEPDLPATYFSLGIPSRGEPRVSIVDLETVSLGQPLIAPIPTLAGTFEVQRYEFLRSAAVYEGGVPFPASAAVVSDIRTIGSQRLASVVLSPVQWNPASRELSWFPRVRVRIDFPASGSAPGTLAGPEPLRESTELRLRGLLANYETARALRDPALARRPAAKRGANDSFVSSSDWIRVEVAQTGVHRITHANLVAAGVANPAGEIGSTGTLRLYNGGGFEIPEALSASAADWMRQVPILVQDGADGRFDSGDEIVFYALGPSGFESEFDPARSDTIHFASRFANVNVYWLTWGGAFVDEEPKRALPALDGAVVAGSGATVAQSFLFRRHEESDFFDDPTRFGEDGWFWQDFTSGSTKVLTSTSAGAAPGLPATLKVRLYGHRQTDVIPFGDYEGNIRWNGVLLGDSNFTWNDRAVAGTKKPFDFKYTGDLATGRVDTIRIQIIEKSLPIRTSSEVYLAWFDLEYQRRYDALGLRTFAFTSPSQRGRIHYDVENLTAAEPILFDVTDPFETRLVTGGALAGGTYSFERDETERRRYALADESSLPSPARMTAFTIDNLRDPSIRADYVIIVADELRSGVEGIRTLRTRDFTVRVVPLSQIAAQFGWGIAQPAAIRNFLRYALFNWDNARGPGFGIVPEYLLLVGDATFDYRGLVTAANKNLMPLYHRVSLDGSPINTFGTDDYYGYLDSLTPNSMVLRVGRLPVDELRELEVCTEKLAQYELEPEFGDWRARVILAADDEMKGCSSREPNSNCWDRFFLKQHTVDVDSAASSISRYYQKVKLYMVEFPFGNAIEKPAAKRAFIEELRRGALMSHYSGHGAFDKMADEGLFSTSDADATVIGNGRRLFVFTAYSCSIGLFDRFDGTSIAEQLVLTPGGGAIASIASDAPAFAGSSFIMASNVVKDLFRAPGSVEGRIGDATLFAKTAPSRIRSQINDEKYQILGDPALQIALPRLPVLLDPHPGFEGGTFTTVGGQVMRGDEIAIDFNGTATIDVSGVADTSGYVYTDPNTGREEKIRYSLPGGSLFRGEVAVTNGRWSAEFFVPTDIRQGSLARVHAYVTNGLTDGAGARDSIPAARPTEIDSTVASDQTGPEIQVAFDDRPLRPNVSLLLSSQFSLQLTDPHGINIQGEDDFYSINVILDEGTQAERASDLTERFRYDFGDSRSGGLTVPFADVVPSDVALGDHTITIQASDNLNNKTSQTTVIRIVGSLGEFRVSDPLNFPNPFSERTAIQYDLTQAADLVTVGIYTVNGRLVREFRDAPRTVGTNDALVWDGRDQDGDPVANGVYFFKVLAQTSEGLESEAIGRAVVVR